VPDSNLELLQEDESNKRLLDTAEETAAKILPDISKREIMAAYYPEEYTYLDPLWQSLQ
jgi:hypothetical protein